MKRARTKPSLIRYADKPLKDWSNADLIDWAQEKCPKVVRFLSDYDGSILANLKKEEFQHKEAFGFAIGSAFYNCLECAPSARPFP